MYPENIKSLIECFRKFPGVGEKTAERMAFAILSFEEEDVQLFGNSILTIKDKVKYCDNCGSLTDKQVCDICTDDSRNKNVLCVVEAPKDIFLFEKLGNFRCKYHVLNGLISPLDGVSPEDLNFNKLIERVEKEKINELIVAIKSGIEGETTALYISKIFESTNVKVTKIATGIPIGAEMDYVDTLTLETAIRNREALN